MYVSYKEIKSYNCSFNDKKKNQKPHQKVEKSHKSFYLLSENMSSTHDQENGAKKSPIFNMCSQMSGFCYDSAKEIAVKNFELPTYMLDTSQYFCAS